jgi:hypothetical protein
MRSNLNLSERIWIRSLSSASFAVDDRRSKENGPRRTCSPTENIGFVDDLFLDHFFDDIFQGDNADCSGFRVLFACIVVFDDDTEMILF